MKKISPQEYKNIVYNLVGNEYTVLENYINSQTKIKMKHNICNTIYEVRPNSFIHRKSRCPNCSKHKSYTPETFKEKVNELVNTEYTVLGSYINSQTKIKIRHNKCGNVYMVKPNTFINGSRCPKCFRSVPYTNKEFREKIFKLVGNKYSVLGDYVNSNTKIKMKHNICGYEYYVLPQNFFRGNRCPICSYELKRSLPEEIVAYFISKYFKIIQSYRPSWLNFETGQNAEIDIWIPELKTGIEYDGNIHKSFKRYKNDLYKNEIIEKSFECKKLIRLRENKTYNMKDGAKKIFIIQAQKNIAITSKRGIDELENMIKTCLILLGINSPNVKINEDIIVECQNKTENYYEEIGKPIRSKKIRTRISNTEEFKERVYNLVGNEYSVLGEYTYALEKLKMRHNKCGYEYEVKPNVFLSGCRCPKCANKIKITTEMYKEKVYKLVKNEYSVIGEYVNNRTKIKMRHNICKNEYDVKPNSFLSGRRCPKCSKNNKKNKTI